MPVASAHAAHAHGADAATLRVLALAVGALVLAVFAWSLWQVRCGRWSHVDASMRSERRGLNRILLAAFGVAALGTWLLAQPRLALAFALAAAIIAIAMLLARSLKLSLHVAFAAFAALVAGGPAVVTGFGLLAAAVAWSRLELGRHDRADVVAGAAVGALAGIVFRIL